MVKAWEGLVTCVKARERGVLGGIVPEIEMLAYVILVTVHVRRGLVEEQGLVVLKAMVFGNFTAMKLPAISV